MNGILLEKYYIHVFLLIKSIRIILLLADQITEVGVKLAEKLLKMFCQLFENYYGIILISYTVLL